MQWPDFVAKRHTLPPVTVDFRADKLCRVELAPHVTRKVSLLVPVAARAAGARRHRYSERVELLIVPSRNSNED